MPGDQCPGLAMNSSQCESELELVEATEDRDLENLNVFDVRRTMNIVGFSVMSAGKIRCHWTSLSSFAWLLTL